MLCRLWMHGSGKEGLKSHWEGSNNGVGAPEADAAGKLLQQAGDGAGGAGHRGLEADGGAVGCQEDFPHRLQAGLTLRGEGTHSSAGSFVLKTEGQGGVVGGSHSRRGGGGRGQRWREVAVVVDAAATRNYLPAPKLCREGGAGPGVVRCQPSAGDGQWAAAGARGRVFRLVGGGGAGGPGLAEWMGEVLVQRVGFAPDYHLRRGRGAFPPVGGLGLAGEQVHGVVGEAGGAARFLRDEGEVAAQAGHAAAIPRL